MPAGAQGRPPTVAGYCPPAHSKSLRMKTLLALLALLTLSACQFGSQPEKQKIGSFFTSSLEAPAGWRIKEVRGFECRFFEYAGTSDYLDRLKGVLRGISEAGLKSGANAFVNARVSTVSHEVAGAKTVAAIVHVCGDYVVVE
jgi:hypothetical protein